MKRGTPDHPKVANFADYLGVRLPHAIGYLELLFHFTARFCPKGDIGRYSDKRIAAGVMWKGKTDRLITALLRSGLIEEHPSCRLVVHDWHEHCDDATKKRVERAHEQFLSVRDKMTGHCPVETTVNADCLSHSHSYPEPEPIKEPDPPNITTPHLNSAEEEPFPELNLVGIDSPLVGEVAPWQGSDPMFGTVIGIFLALGVEMSEQDNIRCGHLWNSLSLEEQRLACNYAQAQAEPSGQWRRNAGTEFVPRPWNYLRVKHWNRARAPSTLKPVSPVEAAIDAAAQRAFGGGAD